MKTRLDRLLECIDPDRTLDDVTKRMDDAFNSLEIIVGRVSEREEFKDCVSRTLGHLENAVLKTNVERNKKIDWGRCYSFLVDEYGTNGENVAFEMARTGADGGFYGVLKVIAKRLAAQYAQNQISCRINEYWNELTVNEKLAAALEYLNKYGHLLPSEVTEEGAVRVRAFFTTFLEEHPRLIQQLRRIGR